MNEENKKLKKQRMVRYFIDATTEIFKEDVSNLTIRNIANKAGYNSATLYNYFKNLDVLINYALVSYMSKIWQMCLDHHEDDALIAYLNLWESKCRCVFENTALYNYFLQLDDQKKQQFYHSSKEYFEIFDDEYDQLKSSELFSEVVEIDEFDSKRNRYIQPCIDQGYLEKDVAIIKIADIIFHGIVYEITFAPKKEMNAHDYTALFFKVFGAYLDSRLLKNHEVLQEFLKQYDAILKKLP